MYQQKIVYFYIGKVTVTVFDKYIFTKKWKTQQIFSLRDSWQEGVLLKVTIKKYFHFCFGL